MSDVVGILIEQEEKGDALTFDRIKKAVIDLYDFYDRIPNHSRTFIESIYEKEDLREFYRECRQLELENKDVLLDFQDDYPGVLNEDNIADILKVAKTKKQK